MQHRSPEDFPPAASLGLQGHRSVPKMRARHDKGLQSCWLAYPQISFKSLSAQPWIIYSLHSREL